MAIPYEKAYTAANIRVAIRIAASKVKRIMLLPPWILKIEIYLERKLTVGDGVDEDKIHFLGSPSTLGIAGRLPIVVAAIIIAGKRIKTGRHEGSGSAPCWIWVFAKLGDFLFENRWSTNLCKNNPFVFGNKLTFTRWIRVAVCVVISIRFTVV